MKKNATIAAAHLQRAPTSGAMLPTTWLQQPGGGAIQNNQTLQVCQQKMRLQSLQQERERLKQRQQEIIRQVCFLIKLYSLLSLDVLIEILLRTAYDYVIFVGEII